MSEAKPIAHLVWQRADLGDDVEAYYEVARPGDKSVDGSDPFPVYELASLTAERDRLREALEFYADELTWADTNPQDDGRLTVLVPSPSFAEIDRGERARAALSPVEEGK